MNPKIIISKMLWKWWPLVSFAHCCALVMGILSSMLGLLIGPTLQVLFSGEQASHSLAVSAFFGPILTPLVVRISQVENIPVRALLESLPLLLICVAFVKGLALFFQWYIWEWLGETLARTWRGELLHNFTKLSSTSRDTKSVAAVEHDLAGLMAQDTRAVREFVVHYYGGLPREGLQVFFTGVTLALLSPELFGVFIFCLAPVGALLSRWGKRYRRRAAKVLEDNSSLSEWIQQRLLGLETIKHLRSETAEIIRMKLASNELHQKNVRAIRLKSRTSPSIELFGIVAMAIALSLAFAMIAKNPESGAVYMSFFSTLVLFAQAAAKLGKYINSNNDGLTAGRRLFAGINTFESNANQAGSDSSAMEVVKVPNAAVELSLRNISVGYDGRRDKALEDFSYQFRGGKIYCVIGKSGAGKSTLLQLILGVTPALSGQVKLSLDAQKFPNASLPVLSIPQMTQLIPTQLALNVSYPSLTYEETRVRDALSHVHFKVDPSRMTAGLATLVGPGGLQLSGGEMQRLSLARMSYHHAPVVVIDEGTSALDPVVEAEVLKSVREIASRGAVVIMVAHRRGPAEASDEVLLLKNGKLTVHGAAPEILGTPEGREVFGVS